MIVIRYLFVLLIGALLGAAGVGFALQKGYGDFFIKPAPVVAELQRRLDGMEQERNRLARQLESVEGRAAKMEKLFADLESRFRGLSTGAAPAAGAAVPAPAEPSAVATPPPAASPSTTVPAEQAGQPAEAPAPGTP
jgi:TolA-binding protein